MKLALVGSDSSHTNTFVARWGGRHELFLAEATRPPGELTADADVASAITVVDSVADLVGRVDGAVVWHRRATQHRAAAVPLLEAGIPVFVDKPLAATMDDAEAILDAASRGGVPVASWSALRWSSVATVAGRMGLTELRLEGPADPESEFDGIGFYGIHLADLAVALLGGPVQTVAVRFDGDDVVADVTINGVTATLVMSHPSVAHGFRLIGQGAGGAIHRPIELMSDYMYPVADIAQELFATKVWLQSRSELLDVVSITEAMDKAVQARGGTTR